MATLEALRAAVLPSARWLAAGPVASGPAARGAGASRATAPDLAWVRLMRARVPAFDALEPGDVAIVPLAALAIVAPDDDAVGSLVRAAADAEIGGIVLVADPNRAAGDPDREAGAGPTALIEAAAAANLPVLDAGSAEPSAIERSAIGFLVNHRAELERQATMLETQLEHVALAGGGPEGFAAAIAGFLARAVAIEGRRGAPLAVHAPAHVPGAAAAAAAYHGRRRAVAARIPLPLRRRGPDAAAVEPIGALVLLGDQPPSELERVATARVAGILVLELAREEAVGQAIDTARREALPADGPPWVVIVARQATSAAVVPSNGSVGEPSAQPPDPVDAARREALRRELRALAPGRRLTLRGDALSVEVRAVAAAPAADPEGMELAGRIASLLGRLVAVSRPFDQPAGRSAAEADARATLEAAERLPTRPAVARADRLSAYRLLGNLHNLPEGERQARALLEPLLRGRPDVRRERLATLRAILDQPGIAEAADVLGVHRNTVAYRVRRIEAATGWRLSDPELRFPLALALRLVQDD